MGSLQLLHPQLHVLADFLTIQLADDNNLPTLANHWILCSFYIIKSNVYIPNQAFPFQTPDSLSGWGAQFWWVRCNSWTTWPPRSITNKKWWFFRPYQSMKKGLLFPLNLQLGSEYTRDILAWLRSRELSAPDCRQKVVMVHFTMKRIFSIYSTQFYDLENNFFAVSTAC